MNKAKRIIKNVLAKKILLLLFVMTIVLISGTGIYVSQHYKEVRVGQYEKLAFSYTRALTRAIDGEKLKEYMADGEKTDYFREIEEYMAALASESEDIMYLYVIKPLEHSFIFILNSASDDSYGKEEAYGEGVEGRLSLVFCKNPTERIYFTHSDDIGYIATVASPIFDSSGNPIALCCADISAPYIEKEQQTFVIGVFIAIAIIVILTSIFFYLYIGLRIVKPIIKLDEAASSFVKNIESSEKLDLNIHTKDEIERLSKSFEEMSSDVKEYINELAVATAEKERIGAELDIAANIQLSMLPSRFPAFPDHTEFDVYATMTPAKEVGGDFYDFFMVDDTHVAIVIADVSGKGVPAALFMVIGKTLIKDHTTPGTDLGEVFMDVNKLLCDSNGEDLFITAFEGVLDIVTGEFRFVNAGHEMPFICKKGGTFRKYPVKPGAMLAILEEMNYQSGVITLEPGDKLFQYTDGIPEAHNKDSELFGMARLEEALVKYSDMDIYDIPPFIQQEVDLFAGDAPQFDDITMICLEFKGA